VSKVVLDRPRIALLDRGQGVTEGMPERVRVSVLDASAVGGGFQELIEAVSGHSATLAHKQALVGRPIAIERPESPQVRAVERPTRILAVLEAGRSHVGALRSITDQRSATDSETRSP
jgi:hypothetical protein